MQKGLAKENSTQESDLVGASIEDRVADNSGHAALHADLSCLSTCKTVMRSVADVQSRPDLNAILN